MSKENIVYNLKDKNIKVYNIVISKGKNKSYRGMHFHREAELVLVLSGEVILHIDDQVQKLKKGQSAYIGMNCIHMIAPGDVSGEVLILQSAVSDKRETDFLFVSDEFLRNFICEMRTEPYAIFLEKDNELSCILCKIEDELREKKDYYETYIQGYLQIIVGFLERNLIISVRDVNDNLSKLKKVEPITNYIAENYMGKISLDDMAVCVGYDKYYICKLVKNNLKTTVTEYLNYVRLQVAQRLLVTSDMRISQIVCETGFSNPQNFFKVFKAMYGYTPHKYKTMYHPTEQT